MAHDGHETASSSLSYFTTTTVDADAAHLLRRQRSTPAAAARSRGARHAPIILGNGGFSGQCAPASRGSPGGVARAVWAWLVRGKKRKVLRRSGSAAAKEQYGQEEYAQNFDEGAAAADEPENLSRSFSARYAGRRLAGAGAVGQQPDSLRSSRWSV
ncbi:hypothetical protein PR202_ga06877 [Eleusine coracana subsp. coracana]|uniref:Uncharacterized protein n=1 Tax=Eleusine coracana subsp. coracana TaxID=191504 RepID=A0AAV5BZE6_ELECO|nr:hypothetical protein QOZ80_2AG0105860 [Eleusine coracana subsp. coracana]GJM90579.1 hypothetical protein PR202_ga06877 [Eleusine coracana subsp. coracana]